MKKKILYVDATTDGTIGGSHYCLLYLLQNLDRTRYDPLVLFYEDNVLVPRFKEAARVSVVKLHGYRDLHIAPLRKAVNAAIHSQFILTGMRLVARERVDLIHLNNDVVATADLWLPISRLTGVRCVTHERGFATLGTTRRSRPDRLSRGYSRVLAVSEIVRMNLVDQGFGPDVVQTVHDGIDADAFRARVRRTREDVLNEFGIPSDASVIGMVGNIREWKGQKYLIESLRVLKSRMDKFACLLIGSVSRDDAGFMSLLRRKISDYGLARNVIVTGYRSDVPDLVNALDVLVNASTRPDPFPHVILEGMALGKVVIATNLGGAIESIADGHTGFLVPASDPTTVADVLNRVLAKPGLRHVMGQAAYCRVRDVFSLADNVRRTEAVYESLG